MMEHTQNIDSVLALTDELNRLRIENENLRRIVRDGQEPVRHRTFLKGLGAGIAFTPAFLWLCWKLICCLVPFVCVSVPVWLYSLIQQQCAVVHSFC